ncbi:F-box/kelch-repeat protein At3g06240-like [Rutidosis leptorrhynchoides]|uniref:F-box/kelch-repeat protein At3g06240-like n=1 Tax=Rutidosis leptorrhynchoides TaxID=125765 RepID=UPI003A98CEBD
MTFRKKIWGFGYDSTTDDYKVVVGFNEDSNSMLHMIFLVLSLKSNKWKVVRDGPNYLTYEAHGHIRDLPGVLFDGALHWLVDDTNEEKKVILSFDLSLEECKEIPQPDDDSYSCDDRTILRMFDQCLCISGFYDIHSNNDNNCGIWVMKNYNSSQLVLPSDDYRCKKYGADATTAYPLDIFPDNTWRFNNDDDDDNLSWRSWFDTLFPRLSISDVGVDNGFDLLSLSLSNLVKV